MNLIALDSVTVRFGRRTVLDNISWRYEEGSGIAVVRGASGSGKTTLLHVVSGMLRPTSGQVKTLGIDVSHAGRAAERLRRSAIGHIFQDFRLLDDLTAAENVAVPLWLAGTGVQPALVRARFLLGEVGIADRWSQRPSQLSGGEQQRTAIARALAAEPRLLLVDEPTANLDDKAGEVVLDLLSAAAALGTGVLIASHDPLVAARARVILEIAPDGRMTQTVSAA